VASCGDSVITTLEACDDGNSESGDGCSDCCVVETGYMCSNTECGPSDCQWKTGLEKCGDGFTLGAEVAMVDFCDDGNTTPGDGCSLACKIECGYECDGGLANAADTCTTSCSNAVKTNDEAYDDGNTVDGDGCSSTCTIEGGYTCIELDTCIPSTCKEVFGNGKHVGKTQFTTFQMVPVVRTQFAIAFQMVPVARIENISSISYPINSVVLDGTRSRDPDGVINVYRWRILEPLDTEAIIETPLSAISQLSNLTPGTYTIDDDDCFYYCKK